MSLYSAFSRCRMKLFPRSQKKGSCAKLMDSPLNAGEEGREGWRVSQIAACLNRKVHVEDVKILSSQMLWG